MRMAGRHPSKAGEWLQDKPAGGSKNKRKYTDDIF